MRVFVCCGLRAPARTTKFEIDDYAEKQRTSPSCPPANTMTSRAPLSPGHATRTSRAAAAAALAHMSCVSSIFFMMALEGTRYMSRWFWLVWM